MKEAKRTKPIVDGYENDWPRLLERIGAQLDGIVVLPITCTRLLSLTSIRNDLLRGKYLNLSSKLHRGEIQ